MKKSVLLLVVLCAIAAGALVYLQKRKLPAPTPAAETVPTRTEPLPPETVSDPKPQPVPAIAPTTPAPAPAPAPAVVAAPAAAETPSEPTNSIHKIVDALLTAHAGKHAMFQQLSRDQLEAVIADLKERAVANANDPEIPTTLGEAQLNLVRQLHESGADEDQVGILAMQADQSFNTALKIDPKNWEAQFVKASTMYYWPPNEARDNDAAQRLANLIDQQEAMPSQPDAFALPYIALGKQYQKMGKMNEAIATWNIGAQKFPGNADLQKLKAGQ